VVAKGNVSGERRVDYPNILTELGTIRNISEENKENINSIKVILNGEGLDAGLKATVLNHETYINHEKELSTKSKDRWINLIFYIASGALLSYIALKIGQITG